MSFRPQSHAYGRHRHLTEVAERPRKMDRIGAVCPNCDKEIDFGALVLGAFHEAERHAECPKEPHE